MNKFELLAKYSGANFLQLVEEYFEGSNMEGYIEIKRELDTLIDFIYDGELDVDSDTKKRLKLLRDDVNSLLSSFLIRYYEMMERKFKDGEIIVRI